MPQKEKYIQNPNQTKKQNPQNQNKTNHPRSPRILPEPLSTMSETHQYSIFHSSQFKSLNFFGIYSILFAATLSEYGLFLIHFNIILFHVEKKTHAAFPTRTCQGNISGMNRSKIGN